jgi:hypothetical protein
MLEALPPENGPDLEALRYRAAVTTQALLGDQGIWFKVPIMWAFGFLSKHGSMIQTVELDGTDSRVLMRTVTGDGSKVPNKVCDFSPEEHHFL